MGYGIGLPALISVVILLLLLILYLEEKRRLAVDFRAWRGRLGVSQEYAAELFSNAWNKKFPDSPKQFATKTIGRWESGRGPFLMNYFRIRQIIDDKEVFDAIAAQARRDGLDTLDAFVGKRTPGSPPRMVAMRMEAFEGFYAEELAADQTNRLPTKKRRRRRKH